ncbi:tail fiber protein [Williamwhitmania taraxaci]|uniref:Phage tail fibre repeat-containing protein n=1 Tax=Williamwhitmania taraxaci TaxID=1640674 RepID=A0A1G6M9D0_9BACT|nr:tail fiber protein [Williamwhitmania taraxaci]SDC52168.1 Phage tail fibre repeat-containing protein [Williamwhitmania taraxaci]
MAVTDKNQIKAWFKRGLKPLASQFEAWLDSYWHREDAIPTSSVDGLNEILIRKMDNDAAAAMITEAIGNISLPEGTLEAKGIVKLSNTPGQSDAEAATPKLVGMMSESAVNAFRGEVYTRSETDGVAATKSAEVATALRDGVPAEGDTLKKLHDLISLLQSLVSSDDVNLDTVNEIVTFIKNNKDVIDTIATNKVNVADIVDNLTSSDTNKPLSANQGRVLAQLLSSTSSTIRLAVGFSVSTEAVTYFPAAATVSKLSWNAADIATVQVSVDGGALSPVTSGAAISLVVASGAPLLLKITYASGKTTGSILLNGTYN